MRFFAAILFLSVVGCILLPPFSGLLAITGLVGWVGMMVSVRNQIREEGAKL